MSRFIRPEDLRLNDHRVAVEPQADRHVSAPMLERAPKLERAPGEERAPERERAPDEERAPKWEPALSLEAQRAGRLYISRKDFLPR